MKLFKKEPNFKLMGKKYYAFLVSGLVILVGLFMFQTKGFNLGIDFSGGTMIEISFNRDVSIDSLRRALDTVGLADSEIVRVKNENKFFVRALMGLSESEGSKDFEEHERKSNLITEALRTEEEKEHLRTNKLDLNNLSEKAITDLLTAQGIAMEDAADAAEKIVNFRKTKEDADGNITGLISDFAEIENLAVKKRVLSVLKERGFLGNFTFLSSEFVGPQVGHRLRSQVTRATFFVLLGMLIYIGFRFKLIYGIAAVITLFHDVLIVLSALLFFNVEVSLPVVAAILTIVGYSLNDTIVIFDRVRDNVKLMRRDDAAKILDRSINQTLSRTIVTSGTTLLTVLALFFFGGEVLRNFSFTLLVGILIGTYSSVFQSCAWLQIWEKSFLGRKKTR